MKIVVFGLTISSSWGNGHATIWRGLCRALSKMACDVVFFERDVAYHAAHRDEAAFLGCDLRLYPSWTAVRQAANRELSCADAAIVTSYCPDALEASELAWDVCPGVRVFYDLDTPITLDRLELGAPVFYVPASGLADFDLVLSFTGGRALDAIRTRLHGRRVAALHGTVDPAVHHPVPAQARFLAQVSHLGTYSVDRRRGIEELFIKPARRLQEARFLLGGAQYPDDFPWQRNVWLLPHVPPRDHPAFLSSARLSLNVTRASMARWGHCPSGRLFEAAACGVPQITDDWEGLDCFFEPGKEICVARSAEDVLTALDMSRGDLKGMARAARERVLDEHSATKRAKELLNLLGGERPTTRGRSSVNARIAG